MSLESPPNTVSVDPNTRQTDNICLTSTSQSEPPGKHESNDLQHPVSRASLSRHYSSLQEHADRRQADEADEDDGGLTPRQDFRRDGFTWGPQPTYDDHEEQRKDSRNPLPPQQLSRKTPPTLDELLHRPTNDDADTAHNARVSRAETGDNHPSSEQVHSYSTAYESSTWPDNRKTSIAWFGRGLVKHVPDTRLTIPSCAAMDSLAEQDKPLLGSVSSTGCTQEIKRGRKLPFVWSTTTTRQDPTVEIVTRHTSDAGQSVASGNSPSSTQASAKGSLRDRRKVKLDLRLPIDVSALPPRNRSPVRNFNGITPWTRNDAPRFPQSAISKTVPVAEENYIGRATCGEGNDALGLLPGDDAIMSSSSPKFEHGPTPKIRDPCFNSRPRSKRSRSGQCATNDDGLARTPDGIWTPDGLKQPKPRQARADMELEQLSKAARSARTGRWRWARSTTRSSDGAPASPIREPGSRQFSINPFRRSGRISDHVDKEKEVAQFPSLPSRLWWIGKQSGAPAQVEDGEKVHLSAPPPFVPPGLTRVPTPQVLDANGEVKNKLADFFFDHAAGIEGRRARASPGVHWDSDALLMSYLSSDLSVGDSTEEEGPEGPATPEYAPRTFTVDRNPGWDTPGLVSTPGGYLDVKRPTPGDPVPSSPEVWFRIPSEQLRRESQLTERALREMEERRKFEWLVPEHLPNSPLCPLHAQYKGYSIGICYWHGRRRSSGSRSKASDDIVGGIYETAKREKRRLRRAAKRGKRDDESRAVRRGVGGWEVGQFDVSLEEARQTKKRRLASFSSP
ncbi:hypothetical protein BDU57DRAFT_458099 [Ampelomyces quisqualis]|uniref:Uncharacterized protein n=1 Tax=Ampelomyces quisqualis TaxID=50730 RepID=A0A6A5QGH3_AMPQU|nr:hypothetical protein BDU57DRAFT_458099 [Ampelomyces quisqualis]